MKNQMLQLFQNMGQEVQKMLADDAVFSAKIESDVVTKYRNDFFLALQVLGESDDLTAQIALEIKLDVNTYDAELSESFMKDVAIPVLTLYLKNKKKLPVYKHLNDEKVLLIMARGISFQYNI
jgi:hypothetical protein